MVCFLGRREILQQQRRFVVFQNYIRLASNKKQWCEIMRIRMRIIESFWFVQIEKNLNNKYAFFF